MAGKRDFKRLAAPQGQFQNPCAPAVWCCLSSCFGRSSICELIDIFWLLLSRISWSFSLYQFLDCACSSENHVEWIVAIALPQNIS